MRVLVTGSRNWTDAKKVRSELAFVFAWSLAWDDTMTVVHGGARGADEIAALWAAEQVAKREPVGVECHPADWKTYGRSAGPIRNVEMVLAGADLCLAFIRDNSPGATHCAGLARKAGIETRVYEWGGSPDA